jgi:hypothetical protein
MSLLRISLKLKADVYSIRAQARQGSSFQTLYIAAAGSVFRIYKIGYFGAPDSQVTAKS